MPRSRGRMLLLRAAAVLHAAGAGAAGDENLSSVDRAPRGWSDPNTWEAASFVSRFFVNLDAPTGSGGAARPAAAAVAGVAPAARRATPAGGPAEPPVGLSIIGAGFGRTGTKSLEAALGQLGHRVYDTASMALLGQGHAWARAVERAVDGDFTEFDVLLADIEARGYTATLDFPMNLLAPLLAKRRPAAKVVMSVRRSEEEWVEAWGNINMVLGVFMMRPWKWAVDLTYPAVIMQTLHPYVNWSCTTGTCCDPPVYPEDYPALATRPLGHWAPWYEVPEAPHWAFRTEAKKAGWIAMHRNLRAELEAQLPRHRFLVFSVKQGWRPLAEFLQLGEERVEELAAQPFPHLNDREALLLVRRAMDIAAAGLPVWALLAALTAAAVSRACARLLLALLTPRR